MERRKYVSLAFWVAERQHAAEGGERTEGATITVLPGALVTQAGVQSEEPDYDTAWDSERPSAA